MTVVTLQGTGTELFLSAITFVINKERIIHIFKFRSDILTGVTVDRLRSLVVRVPGYRFRGPGFDFRRYQIF
jgi:hypothetical protein